MKGIFNKFFGSAQSQQPKNNQRFDSGNWENALNTLARSQFTTFVRTAPISDETLSNLYTADGIAKAIVNLVVDEAMMKGISADDLLITELKRLKYTRVMGRAGKMARLFGGSLLVVIVNDGFDSLDRPLDKSKIKRIVALKEYSRPEISWSPADIDKVNFDNFDLPEYYTITPSNSECFRVHYTRCFRFFANDTTPIEKRTTLGWDSSVLCEVYSSLCNAGIVDNSITSAIQDSAQKVIYFPTLYNSETQGNSYNVAKRLGQIEMTSSNERILGLATTGDGKGGERYEKVITPVSGWHDILKGMANKIAAKARIPISKLFGEAPSGLNATGNNDMENWYNTVQNYREDPLNPCLTWLIGLLEVQMDWKDKPETFRWEFPELKIKSEVEAAQIAKLKAETTAIYSQITSIHSDYLYLLDQLDLTFDETHYEEWKTKNKDLFLSTDDLEKAANLVNEVKVEHRQNMDSVKDPVYQKLDRLLSYSKDYE